MSVWFDYTTYLNNKVAQLQKTDKAGDWTLPKVMQAFADAGFGGEAGAEQHFVQFGQYEDVAPNAFFNPMEYYRAKAAEVNGKQNAPQTVTEIEVNEVMMAIKGLKMGAWTHFKTFGNDEHVNPSNQFDSDAYVNAKVVALNAVRPDGQAEYTAKDVYAAFKGMGISALEHFMMFGGDATKGEVPYTYDGTIPSVFEVPLEKQVKPDNSNAGYTFSLTADSDIINSTTNSTGKPSAAAFASALDDTFVAGVANSLNAGDNLDGAGGHNTLRIVGEAAGSANLGSVTLANVQTVEFTGKVTTDAPLDASMHKGVVKNLIIKNVDATAAVDSASAAASATFAADISQTVTLAGDLIFADGKGGIIDYKGLKTDGTDNSATVKMNGLTVKDADLTDGDMGSITIDGVENLTLNLTGTNDFVTLSDTGLKNLTLTGPGTAKGTVETSSGATITSINASTSGGADLTVDTGNIDTAGFTYTGSKNSDKLEITGDTDATKLIIDLGDGDNELSINVSAGLASGSSFKAGAGVKDKLVIAASAASAVTSDIGNTFSGFEVLSTAVDGLNVSLFKDITSVEVTASAGLVGLNAKQAENILVTGSTDVSSKTFSLKDASGDNDSIGFTLKHEDGGTGHLDLTGVVLTGFENLTLQAASGTKTIVNTASTAYTNVSLGTSAELKKVTLAGDYALQFDMNSNGAKITEINASTNTAGVDVRVGGQTGALKVTGSDKADHFTIGVAGAGGSLTLNAGAGDDIVSGTVAAITAATKIDGGAGKNILEFTDSGAATGASFAISDSAYKTVTGISEILYDKANAGDTNITLAGYADRLGVANNGILKVTAEKLVADGTAISTDTISFDSTGMLSTGVDLSLKNTGKGNITVATGDANDTITVVMASNDATTVLSINGGDGDDTITVTATSAYASTSVINGGAGNDTINGSSVADIILGGSGNDTIKAGDGNDIITGGAGADILTGGSGDDIFRYEAAGESNGANIDHITDFKVAGADTINLSGNVLKGVTITVGTTTVGTSFQSNITIASAADLADLQAQLTNSAAVKAAYTGSAATAGSNQIQAGLIVVTDGAFAGKYILINDTTAGYNAADDMLINVTGISGTLAATDFTFTA